MQVNPLAVIQRLSGGTSHAEIINRDVYLSNGSVVSKIERFWPEKDGAYTVTLGQEAKDYNNNSWFALIPNLSRRTSLPLQTLVQVYYTVDTWLARAILEKKETFDPVLEVKITCEDHDGEIHVRGIPRIEAQAPQMNMTWRCYMSENIQLSFRIMASDLREALWFFSQWKPAHLKRAGTLYYGQKMDSANNQYIGPLFFNTEYFGRQVWFGMNYLEQYIREAKDIPEEQQARTKGMSFLDSNGKVKTDLIDAAAAQDEAEDAIDDDDDADLTVLDADPITDLDAAAEDAAAELGNILGNDPTPKPAFDRLGTDDEDEAEAPAEEPAESPSEAESELVPVAVDSSEADDDEPVEAFRKPAAERPDPSEPLSKGDGWSLGNKADEDFQLAKSAPKRKKDGDNVVDLAERQSTRKRRGKNEGENLDKPVDKMAE